MSETFRSSDVWLLITLAGLGSRGGLIPEILSHGDYHNHAIFNKEELRGGLVRFMRCGYARADEGRFFIDGEAASFVRCFPGNTRAEVWDLAYGFLGVERGRDDDPREGDEDSDYPWLSDTAIENAYEEWRGESQAMIDKVMSFVKQKLP